MVTCRSSAILEVIDQLCTPLKNPFVLARGSWAIPHGAGRIQWNKHPRAAFVPPFYLCGSLTKQIRWEVCPKTLFFMVRSEQICNAIRANNSRNLSLKFPLESCVFSKLLWAALLLGWIESNREVSPGFNFTLLLCSSPVLRMNPWSPTHIMSRA